MQRGSDGFVVCVTNVNVGEDDPAGLRCLRVNKPNAAPDREPETKLLVDVNHSFQIANYCSSTPYQHDSELLSSASSGVVTSNHI